MKIKIENGEIVDKLDEMFEKQIMLQKRLGVKFDQEYMNNMALALFVEVGELTSSMPFKSWKKNQVMDDKNFKYELADILHFTINLALARGITAEELHKEFISKNKENHERQDNGY